MGGKQPIDVSLSHHVFLSISLSLPLCLKSMDMFSGEDEKKIKNSLYDFKKICNEESNSQGPVSLCLPVEW